MYYRMVELSKMGVNVGIWELGNGLDYVVDVL